MHVGDIGLRFTDLEYARGIVRYLHGDRELTSCALDKSTSNRIVLYLPRALGTRTVEIEIYSESCKRMVTRITFTWEGTERGTDRYLSSVLALDTGLYFYRMCLDTPVGRLFGYLCDGHIAFAPDAQPTFQLSLSDFTHPAPSCFYGGIIYHIFVDRFRRGDTVSIRQGGILGDFSHGIPEYPAYPGAPLKNNTFYGGSLYGIIDALPHLCALGVSILYLSPVFESPSNHKYDTADYHTVDAAFGGEDALRLLIEEAKKLGIGIVLDGVFNHTGSDSIYFNKYGNYPTLGAYQSTESPYFSWFDFQSYPDRYTCWWNIDILPRLRTDLKSVQSFFVGRDGPIRKYAKMGISGMRLDVADELPDTFIAKIKSALYEENPETLLYGEVWEDASNKIAYDTRKQYYLGQELDGVMNYPVRDGLIDYLVNSSTDKLRYALTELTDHTPERILHAQMNLLGTHDTARILTVLAGEDSQGLTNDALATKRLSVENYDLARRRLLVAYTILATLPGIPSIYYGDDAGLEGYGDPFNRMPYPWDNIDDIIHNHYKKIGQIRRNHDVYREGEFRLYTLEKDVLIFARENSRHAYITVVNLGERPLRITSSVKFELLTRSTRRTEFVVSPTSADIFRLPLGGDFAYYFL